LGIPCNDRVPMFFVRPERAAVADSFWATHFQIKQKPVVGIFLGGKVDRPERIWPPEYFARVARGMIAANCELLAIAPPRASGRVAHKRNQTFWMDEAYHEREFFRHF